MKLLLLLCAACVSLPHLDPAPRTEKSERADVAAIYSYCSEANPLDPGLSDLVPHQTWPSVDWGSHSGTGVVVSERHIVTANHVVECPIIPVVIVVLANGRRTAADVTSIDRDADTARLEMSFADNFGIGAVPPALATPHDLHVGDKLCTYAWGRASCGEYLGPHDGRGYLEAATGPGWSGAPVYTSDGRLAGIVLGGSAEQTRFAFSSASWLSGT